MIAWHYYIKMVSTMYGKTCSTFNTTTTIGVTGHHQQGHAFILGRSFQIMSITYLMGVIGYMVCELTIEGIGGPLWLHPQRGAHASASRVVQRQSAQQI